MTKEQLAELEEQALWDDPADDGGGADRTEWLLPTGALKRLLEERKRLLEALAGLRLAYMMNASHPKAWELALQAITFAEEATR